MDLDQAEASSDSDDEMSYSEIAARPPKPADHPGSKWVVEWSRSHSRCVTPRPPTSWEASGVATTARQSFSLGRCPAWQLPHNPSVAWAAQMTVCLRLVAFAVATAGSGLTAARGWLHCPCRPSTARRRCPRRTPRSSGRRGAPPRSSGRSPRCRAWWYRCRAGAPRKTQLFEQWLSGTAQRTGEYEPTAELCRPIGPPPPHFLFRTAPLCCSRAVTMVCVRSACLQGHHGETAQLLAHLLVAPHALEYHTLWELQQTALRRRARPEDGDRGCQRRRRR